MTSRRLRVLDNPSPEAPQASCDRCAGEPRDGEERRRSFLRMASHELRTPLNSIIGFSEIIACELYGPVSDPRYREHAEIVRDSGLRLLKLVNQMMEIARLESGAAEVRLVAEPARPIVEEAVATFAADAAARGVLLRVEAEPGLPAAMTDQRTLKSALSHLLQNALTYAPDGSEVVVALSTRAGRLCIAVRDQGPGVAPAELPRLMRPFEQGEAPLTRRAEGAGLGLPIVRLLCRAMEGSLRLRSVPGEGFTATIRLRTAALAPVRQSPAA